jgi:hypothetical protein
MFRGFHGGLVTCLICLANSSLNLPVYTHLSLLYVPPSLTSSFSPSFPPPPLSLKPGDLNSNLSFNQVSQGRHNYEVVVTDASGLTVRNLISFESESK